MASYSLHVSSMQFFLPFSPATINEVDTAPASRSFGWKMPEVEGLLMGSTLTVGTHSSGKI